MRRPIYTDAFRATVVAALIAEGYPDRAGALTKVSKAFGLHARTLQRWANGENNAPPDNIVIEKKGDMADLIESEIYAVLGVMPRKRSDANYSQLTIALGVLIDKMRLLRNLPTEIVAVLPDLVEVIRRKGGDPVQTLTSLKSKFDSLPDAPTPITEGHGVN